ncbi:hypothetical protein C9I89_09585 [Photobacterium lipolyticum]|uniref:Uncharacterized protein n=1 Tax=Photobacterium lipolyticum TaxID=266810 RepID=A0A2T3MZQ2_9GAMM|nr:hypothetical protein C9I89_09585 [Photobacterium lipolyticum]
MISLIKKSINKLLSSMLSKGMNMYKRFKNSCEKNTLRSFITLKAKIKWVEFDSMALFGFDKMECC